MANLNQIFSTLINVILYILFTFLTLVAGLVFFKEWKKNKYSFKFIFQIFNKTFCLHQHKEEKVVNDKTLVYCKDCNFIISTTKQI
jgi:hypothetical protein